MASPDQHRTLAIDMEHGSAWTWRGQAAGAQGRHRLHRFANGFGPCDDPADRC